MGFLDSILGFLGGIGSEIEQVLLYIFNLLVQIAVFIWNVLVALAEFVLSALKSIAAFFRHIWDSFFKNIFLRLFHGLQSLTRWLEAHLRPIIQYLRRMQRLIDRLYARYVRPFIVMIQHVRQFLLILKALHVKFAAELDAILGKVQRDVQGVFLQIRGILNATIDMLNIIADPTMLLRRPTLLLSFRRVFYSLIRQVTHMPPGFWLPSPRKSAGKGLGFMPANFNAADEQMNPAPSYYMGVDAGVPSLEFQDPTLPVSDSLVDDVKPLDFFSEDAYGELRGLGGRVTLAQVLETAGRMVKRG